VTERDGNGQNLRPAPPRDAIEVPDNLGEERIGIELLDRGLQQCAGPRQRRRACRERAHGTRTQLRPPPLGVKRLLGPSGVFEGFIEVERQRTAHVHGDTSGEISQALARGGRGRGDVAVPV